MCVVAGLMVSWCAPNGSKNKLYSFSRRILLVQDGPDHAIAAKEEARNGTLGPLWGHFGGTLGSLWIYDGDLRSLWDHCGIIVESLWVYEGTFSKTLISRTYFNDFIKGMSEFGIDLGLLWDVFWHMRVTLGSFWGNFGVILGI